MHDKGRHRPRRRTSSRRWPFGHPRPHVTKSIVQKLAPKNNYFLRMPPATPLIKVQYVYSRLDYTMYFIPRSFRYVRTYTLYLFEKLKYNRILEQRKKVTLWRPKSDIHEFRLRGGVDVRDRHQCDGGGLHGLGWNNNDGKKTCCNPSVKSCSTTFQIGSFLRGG